MSDHPTLTDPPTFIVPPTKDDPNPDFEATLLIALGGGEQIDPDHWVQRIHDLGSVVGFHVHHRAGKKWTEQRVLFADLLDLPATNPGGAHEPLACPECGELLHPNGCRCGGDTCLETA